MFGRVRLVALALSLAACSDTRDEASPQDSSTALPDAGPADASLDLFDGAVFTDAQAADATVQLKGCEPGRYVGIYTCEGSVLPEGPLEFLLEVNERLDPGAVCTELCPNLIIKEGSGKLRGVWTLAGFEGQLQGGLECETGKFEAKVVDGVWGLPPSEPDGSVLAVDKFQATLRGTYTAGKPERIEGTWDIKPDIAVSGCTGTIKLQHE